MLNNRWFWIAMAVIVPVTIIWIAEGLFPAIMILVIVGMFVAFVAGKMKRHKQRVIYVGDDDDNIDETMNLRIEVDIREEKMPGRSRGMRSTAGDRLIEEERKAQRGIRKRFMSGNKLIQQEKRAQRKTRRRGF